MNNKLAQRIAQLGVSRLVEILGTKCCEMIFKPLASQFLSKPPLAWCLWIKDGVRIFKEPIVRLEDPIQFLQLEQILSRFDHRIWGGGDIELTGTETSRIEAKLDIPTSVLE